MSIDKLPAPLDALDRKDQVHRTLARGETLFVQDNATTGLFFLVSGTIDLKRTTKSGHDVIIHRARSGDTFAEASLFSDKYHCTAIAAREALAIECSRSAILQLLTTDIDFTLTMASRFASQIQDGRRRVELLSIRAADERIIAALNDGLLIDDITSFAEAIGLAPETVYRTLAKLNKQGVVSKSARGQFQLRSG